MNIYKSDGKCFVCSREGKTVQLKGKDLSVPLCLEHAYEHIPEKDNGQAKPKTTARRKKKESAEERPQERTEVPVQ